MNQHQKKHHPEHAHNSRSAPHKDWRLWVAVGLMLAAMLGYILSMDEEIQPDGAVQPQVPAAP